MPIYIKYRVVDEDEVEEDVGYLEKEEVVKDPEEQIKNKEKETVQQEKIKDKEPNDVVVKN
jgi:hypothetical protein